MKAFGVSASVILFTGVCCCAFSVKRDAKRSEIRLAGSNDIKDSTLTTYEQCGPTAVCVPYDLCILRNNTIQMDGSGLLDVRMSRRMRTNVEQSPCYGIHVCCELPSVAFLHSQLVTTPSKGCGLRNSNGMAARISHGQTTEFGEFPWMVMIVARAPRSDKGMLRYVYRCGGSLIHPKVVLTAAHCINDVDASGVMVRAGEWSTDNTMESLSHQNRLVERIIVHEDFQSGPLFNDVALLILEQPFHLSDHIDVVCLPDWNTPVIYTRCLTSGWGKNDTGDIGLYQHALKVSEASLIPKGKCQSSLRQTRLGKYFILHGSFICAGESDADTCEGDGGGPLVCPLQADPRRYAQVGIVSWGIGCAIGFPSVYANVKYLRRWIDEQMIQNELNAFSYQVS